MPVFDLEIDDRIYIGDNIVITLTDVRDGDARIGSDAPKHIPILRDDAVMKTKKEVGR